MKHHDGHERSSEPEIHAVSAVDGGVVLDLFIPETLVWFEGHFADAPILPGVVQIDWALLLGRRHLSIGPTGAHSMQVKFRKVFGPGGGIRLFLEKRGADTLRFEYRRGDDLMSSGSLKLFPEEQR